MFNRSKSAMLITSALLLSGCSTIYIGNVKFSKQEVCSKEYASFLSDLIPDFIRPNNLFLDCLPPTTIADEQRYLFSRFRLPIDVKEIENSTPNPISNPISIIGKTFITGNSDNEWSPPSTGNLFLIPTNTKISEQLSVKQHFKSSISGITEINSSFATDANIDELISTTLGIKSTTNAINNPIIKAIKASAIKFGAEKASRDASLGQYYYYSIEPNTLASMTTAFEICGWSTHKASKANHQNPLKTSPHPLSKSSENKNFIPCTDKIKDKEFINTTVKELILDIESTVESMPAVEHIGIITGAAIIRTRTAYSNSCSKYQIDIAMKNSGSVPQESAIACKQLNDELQNLISKYEDQEKITTPNPTPAINQDPIKVTAASLTSAIDIAYTRGNARTMELEDHASILAIQWIPLDVRDK